MKNSLLKIVMTIFTFCILCTTNCSNVSAETYGNYEYQLIDNGTHVMIKKYNGSESIVKIPAKIEGKPVTSLGWGSFAENASITEVVMPDSVKTADGATFFECSNLKK